MRKKKILIIGTIFFIILIVFGIGFYMYNKPRQSAANEAAVGSLTAALLFKQYQENEHVADRNYLGKVIEVQGVLSTISQDDKLDILFLSSGNPAGGINCQLFAGNKNNTLKVGDAITVKGKCTGFLMDVNMVDCVIK